MRMLVAFAVLAAILTGCAALDELSPKTKTGAAIGAVVGGVAGYIIDDSHPWRGAVIGAAGGAVVGGLIGNVVDRAAREAAAKNAAVQYTRTTDQGIQETVVADPKGTEGNYKLVNVKYYRDGKLVAEEVKKVPIE